MTLFFSLVLPFSDSHVVVGSLVFNLARLPDQFDAEWGGLRIIHKA